MLSPSRPHPTTAQAPTPLRAGTYPARLSQWIDLGTHPSPFQAGKTLRTCRLTFTLYLPNQEQRLVSKDFTLSLHARSGLRKFLESWRGQPMTPEDLSDFHPQRALEKPALLSVTLSDPDPQGRRWPRIAGILRLPHGLPPPPDLRTPGRHFNLEEPSRPVFLSLPAFLQSKIRSSSEWETLQRQTSHA